MTSRRTAPPPPIAIDDLVRRTAELWSTEPDVTHADRQELLTELHELEHELDALLLRSNAGLDVPARSVRRCAERYLWLRERWSPGEVAA